MKPTLRIHDSIYRAISLLEEAEQEITQMSNEQESEAGSVLAPATAAIRETMTVPGRKHPPFSYLEEPESEHVFKAMRHLTTHLIQRDGYQAKDGEDHLALALTRVAMALAKREQLKGEPRTMEQEG